MQGRGVGGGAPLLAEGSIALLALSQSDSPHREALSAILRQFKIFFKNNFSLFFFLYRKNSGSIGFSHWGCC